jgi:hypothetical protein
MISNLRSRSIEGHIADSAGNVLRNASVVIKQVTPGATFVVATVQSDDEGYFISNPLPNGTYDIYESGTKISTIIHTPDANKIQCFKSNKDNYDITSIKNFSSLASEGILNSFRIFVQIENATIDIYQYGNTFPIYDKNLLTNPDIDGSFGNLYNLAKFFEFNSNSRITTTRFDVEYFSPLTISSSNSYKRIRWAGMPAIKFYQDSRLVIPLDYYSIIANNPKIISPEFAANAVNIEIEDSKYATISEIVENGLLDFSYSVSIGDIVKIRMYNGGETRNWYGIINYISEGTEQKTIRLELWESSRYISDDMFNSGTTYVTKLFGFDGMFSSIVDVDEEANSRFTVVENIFAQNNESELYNYPIPS